MVDTRDDAEDFTGILNGHSQSVGIDQSEEDKQLIARLREEFFAAQQVRLSYERDWELYRQYIKGEQLVVHRITGDIIRLDNSDGGRLRSIRNHCRPAARALIGKLSRVKPALKVIPATADWNEQHGAATADKLLEYFSRVHKLDVRYVEVCNMIPWAGNGFLQLRWEPTKGKKIAFCEVCDYVGKKDEIASICPQCESQREMEIDFQQQEMILQAQVMGSAQKTALLDAEMQAELGEQVDGIGLQEALQTPISDTPPPIQPIGPLPAEEEPPALIELAEGEIGLYVRDPRDVFVPEGSENLDRASWVMYREVMTVPEARSRFPAMAAHIQVEYDVATRESAGYRYSSYGGTGELREFSNHVTIYEWHERPTEAYPNGRIIHQTQTLILSEEEGLWGILDRFPFYHFGWDVNNGEFWREPPMQQAWHRQREMNRVEEAIREHTEISSRPKWLIALQNLVSVDEISSVSNQVIKWSGMGPEPKQISPAPVPQDLWTRGESLSADIYQLFGVTENEAGVATADPNGRAMAIMEAESNQTIGPQLTRNNAEWKEMHKGLLGLAVKYYHNDRLWAIPGSDGYEIFSMKELDLGSGWDIILAEEESMSRNPAVRLQQAMDLANVGVFLDPNTGMLDKKAFLRAAKLSYPESGYDLEKFERSRAAQIPYRIQKGWEWEPKDYDNPMIYTEVLKGWLLSADNRKDIDGATYDKVYAIFQWFNQWLVAGMMPDPALMGGAGEGQAAGASQPQQGTPAGGSPPPGASQPGQDMSAAGGSANNPGHMSSDAMGAGSGPNAAAAQQTTAKADQQLEGMAQTTRKHEG